MAASICERSKPIASMSAMTPSRLAPMAMELGSLKPASASAGGALPAGVGVAGAAAGMLPWMGAGAAGVAVRGAAGVWGGLAEVDAAGAGAGAALGWNACQRIWSRSVLRMAVTLFTMQTTKPFSSIL
jgi:hypothetical protein